MGQRRLRQSLGPQSAVAQIDCRRGEYAFALEHIERSLVRNVHNCRARNLKAYILRKLGLAAKAEAFARETLAIDPLDLGARYELAKALEAKSDKDAAQTMTDWAQTFTGREANVRLLSIDYYEAGDNE